MLGLWLENNALRLRDDIAIPVPKAGEALVQVLQTGICNTDLELVKGYYPYTGILGHEFVGIVSQGPDHLLGQRVVGEINASCGHCEICHQGRKTHCPHRTVLGIVNHNGAFAEYLVLPSENLLRVPDNVSNDEAIFIEPLAAALEIQQQLFIKPTDKVLVLGTGKLGILIAQTLKLRSCELLVVNRNPEKLDFLTRLGIAGQLPEQLTDKQFGQFDIVIEATGSPEGVQKALKMVRPQGTIVLKSTYADLLTINAETIVVNEITLLGSRCGPFEPALNLLAQKLITVTPLIQARYPLREAVAAFAQAAAQKTLKVVLTL